MTNAETKAALIAETKATLIADIIASNDEKIAKLEADLESHENSSMIVSHSWVVVMPLLGCMQFTLVPEGRKFRATEARPTCKVASRSNLYVKEDAIKLAADISNDAGERGVAMHWTDAAKAELAKLKEANEMFNEMA